MANYEMLNNVEHRDLKVTTRRGTDVGDGLQYVMTFPIEFRSAQTYYPIFFQKDPETGRFFPILLLGFEEGENLYLGPEGWDVPYIPMSILRVPFLIGFQQNLEKDSGKQAVLTVDMDSPRITNAEDGQRLFLEHGGSSPYLDNVVTLLEDIQLGLELNPPFIDALTAKDLIEGVALNVTLNDGAQRQLLGMYTINEEKLNELHGDALATLHKEGHLQSIYMILASQANFAKLIERRNARLPSQTNDAA